MAYGPYFDGPNKFISPKGEIKEGTLYIRDAHKHNQVWHICQRAEKDGLDIFLVGEVRFNYTKGATYCDKCFLSLNLDDFWEDYSSWGFEGNA